MWSIFKKFRRPKPAEPPEKMPDSAAAVRRWLEQEGTALPEAIDSLARLMADPVLGGPGFLTVALPQEAGASAVVSCQYPNISEALYGPVFRGTEAGLLEAGVPAELLRRGLRWEAESGTVVTLTLNGAPVSDELAALLAQLHSRNQVLGVLAGELSRRCPGFSVRPLAGYLLLTPETAPTPAAPPDHPPPEPGERPG